MADEKTIFRTSIFQPDLECLLSYNKKLHVLLMYAEHKPHRKNSFLKIYIISFSKHPP